MQLFINFNRAVQLAALPAAPVQTVAVYRRESDRPAPGFSVAHLDLCRVEEFRGTVVAGRGR